MTALEGATDKLDIEFSVISGSNPDLLLGCLQSLHETMDGSPYHWLVTVICNEPDPALSRGVSTAHPRARVIVNPVSKGFAENHNRVLRASQARYVWLLNDDLVILEDTVARITSFLDAAPNSKVAVVSPKLLNPDGTLQHSTYSFPTMPQIALAHSGLRDLPVTNALLRRVAPTLRPRKGSSRFWDHDTTVEVDTLRGACVAVRMTAVREVGVMVEVARVGAEETEWHRRFHDAGWKVVYFAEASVVHFGSQTVRAGNPEHYYPEYLKGALYFFRNRRSAVSYSLFCLGLIAMFGVRALFNAISVDRTGYDVTRQYLRIAWDGLVRNHALGRTQEGTRD